jgi:Holliday junction resolvase RusA-like endonuclease
MQIRFHLYAVPRSFQTMTKDERDEFKTFLASAIDEQLNINPYNNAVLQFLPFHGRVKVSIHWCINTINTEQTLDELNWGDIDNVAKPIMDSLQGKVIKNDRQVTELSLLKHSLKDFSLSERPVEKMTYATYSGSRAVSLRTDFVFIEVCDATFHV